MGQRIDQFCEDLRLKLTNIDSGLSGLKAKIDGKAEAAEQDVRSHLDQVHRRVEQDRAKVSAAKTDVKNWVAKEKTETSATIAQWKAKHEASKLQDRADQAERYAAAAADVAVAALDEAEQAALEAWLARQDADSVQMKKTSELDRDGVPGAWGWMLASGLADLALAAIIFAGWPGAAAWTLGLLVGINLITSGGAIVRVAPAARRAG